MKRFKHSYFFLIGFLVLLGCSEDGVEEESFESLLQGRWEIVGSVLTYGEQYELDFEFSHVPPKETIIEIVLRDSEIDHGEFGPLTSNVEIRTIKSYHNFDPNWVTKYRWVEYGKIMENFDFWDCGDLDRILYLSKDKMIWMTGPGCVGFGVKRELRKVF